MADLSTISVFVKRRFSRTSFSGLPLTLMLLALAYAAALFSGLIEKITISDAVVAVDIRIANLLHTLRETEFIAFFLGVTLLGTLHIVVVGAVIATILLSLRRRGMYILPLWFTMIGSEILSFVAKLVAHRPRPEIAYYAEYGFSFPSAHATIAVAFYGFITYILMREAKQSRHKALVLTCGSILILAIGVSRLYLGVHYMSDVLMGYLSGLVLLIVGIALAERMRRFR